MISKITQSFYDLTGRRLSNVSQLKLFNILRDHDGTEFFNILRSYSTNSIVFNDVKMYDSYEVTNDDWWDSISQKVYNSPYLWWAIALVNDILNPFEELEEGKALKVLRTEYLYVLIRDLENIRDLGK